MVDLKQKRILVIGDIMLDKYISGTLRENPEAPALCLKMKTIDYQPGGAANVATNLKELGMEVDLVGALGTSIDGSNYDFNGRILLKLMRHHKINTLFLLANRTTTKTRVISKNRQLIRIDDDGTITNPKINITSDYDAILIIDYDKGMITKKIIEDASKHTKHLILDLKPNHLKHAKNAFLLKMNYKEAQQVTRQTGREPKDIEKMCKKLQNKAQNIIITNSEKGMTIYENKKFHHIQAEQNDLTDIIGCGDTVTATIAAYITNNYNLTTSCIIANVAAGIVAKKPGTTPIKKYELQDTLHETKERNQKEIEEISKELKKEDKKIVFTNGCFDLIHPGHIKLLTEAKNKGDTLIIGLNSDESIKQIKGPNRPIQGQQERKQILEALQSVDYIVLFDEPTPIKLIEIIKPTILVKGNDYQTKDIIGAQHVLNYGGKVETIPIKKGYSTTTTIKRIQNEQTGTTRKPKRTNNKNTNRN